MAEKAKYSKYHPDRPCGECILCGKKNHYYSHYGGWEETEKNYLKKHLGRELSPSSCICITHHKEAKRPHPPGFSPKWKKCIQPPEQLDKPHCTYDGCTEDSKLIVPSFASSEQLKIAIHTSLSTPILLCPKHYTELYREFNAPQLCACCDAKPKTGTRFSRHSPNASLVNEVLNTDISDKDVICFGCYKNHLAIIKHLETENSGLESYITIWKCVLSDATTDKITKTVLNTVL